MARRRLDGEADMLGGVASMAIRHPRRMAVYAPAVFVVAGVTGGPALGLLNAANPFSDPSSARRASAHPAQARRPR